LNFAIAIVFGMLVVSAVSDVLHRRIPNSMPMIVAVSFLIAGAASPDRVDLIGGLWVAGLIFIVGFVGFALGKIGGGDVKLMAAVGLWAGPAAAIDYLVLTGLAGGALALLYLLPEIAHAMTWLRATAERHVPSLQAVADKGDVKVNGLPYGVAIAAGGMFVLWSRYWPG
jgi:prepilin peptidase CpaA